MKNLAILTMLAVLFVSGILLIRYRANSDVYWVHTASFASPDGRFEAHEYRYTSDADRHAPYGSYVFLTPVGQAVHPARSHVAFAGYCANRRMVEWLSPLRVKLSCIASETEAVRTQSAKAYGVEVLTEIIFEEAGEAGEVLLR